MKRSRVAVFVWLLSVTVGVFFMVWAVVTQPDGWGGFVFLGAVMVAGCAYLPAWRAAVDE